ncbi:MAG: hypothetical protein IT558_02850 [Alphaproteobacteria bacterium]|nr:hypothetical protein [Alphaproteobacteria bacterium]
MSEIMDSSLDFTDTPAAEVVLHLFFGLDSLTSEDIEELEPEEREVFNRLQNMGYIVSCEQGEFKLTEELIGALRQHNLNRASQNPTEKPTESPCPSSP